MVPQKKGSSFRLLASGESSQYNCFESDVSRTYSEFSINKGSAPVKTSCQRKPSIVMMKRCFVLATGCAEALRTNSPAVSKGRMNFILMGLSKLYDGYDHMFITRLTFYYASPVRYMAFKL